MKDKSILLFLFCCLSSLEIFSQGRLVMNDDGCIVISNGAYVVLDNSNANALTQTGTGGRIISEGETNRLRWNVSNATGTYVVPFYDNDNVPTSTATDEIPLTVTINAAGTAGATNHIDFSTYDGSWDNNTYRPTGVTNMGNVTIPAANNSAKVVDRFWIIDANHATKPSVTLSFTYIDNEWSVASNSITEANLRAQRWNATAGDWDGFVYVPAGTINTATNIVSAVNAPAADFFRSWTLVDNTAPLPIELLSNEVECSEKNIVFKWTTATETNNDFFTIQRSIDGINFIEIGTIDGAGTSSSTLNYSYTDYNSFNGISYYRLKQTDYNGDNKTFGIITAQNCNSSDASVNAYNDQTGNIAILINTESTETYTATLFDAQGKKISGKLLETSKGVNNFHMDITNINTGIYFLTIDNGSSVTFRKIFVN